jgi:hypothetical protein
VTKEFVNSLKKVAPSLGMSMGSPKIFMLTDNRPATYIQQLDQVIDMKPAIVMIVIPNNKVKDLRFVLSKSNCISSAGRPLRCREEEVLH